MSLLELNDDLCGCCLTDVDICVFRYIAMECVIYGNCYVIDIVVQDTWYEV